MGTVKEKTVPLGWAIPALGLVVLLLGVVVVFSLRGRGLRMSFEHRLHALFDHRNIRSTDSFTNVVFLHHSVGRNLIRQGKVRERLMAAGFELWDHDYNYEGLTRPDGTRTGYSYHIPNDDTDPDGLARLLTQHVYPWPINALSGLMQHDVIVLKSCFPASNIATHEQLGRYQEWYLAMRDVMDQHPDRLFILLTPPPLHPASTSPEAAARARTFADWLSSEEYTDGHPNVFVFDLFGLLAENDPAAPDFNMLRKEYRDGADSHPNAYANEAIGPLLADFIIQSAEQYRARISK